jgi:poly(glycerol-phosphate) alpha-glucosyltransferase
MKVNLLSGSNSRSSGGLYNSVRCLAQNLFKLNNIDISFLAHSDQYSFEDLREYEPIKPFAYTIFGPSNFGFSKDLVLILKELSPDIVHTQGIWMYYSIANSRHSARTGMPYVISPRGMLDPWALQNSALTKKIAAFLFERKHLARAHCLHALTKQESNVFRNFGLKNPIAIIPNGIDLPLRDGSILSGSEVPWFNHISKGQKVLLFLSRIHPKKGLINLLKALAAILKSNAPNATDWVLCIAGWDQDGHEKELKNLATELKLRWTDCRKSSISVANTVLFLGPQFKDAKATCYSSATAFILPSFSEGFPMVILEAWAYGKPVLMTPECNLPEGFEVGAAIPISSDTAGITDGLRILMDSTEAELKNIGENGRRLVAEKFTWPKIAAEVKKMYHWVLGGGTKPDSII